MYPRTLYVISNRGERFDATRWLGGGICISGSTRLPPRHRHAKFPYSALGFWRISD